MLREVSVRLKEYKGYKQVYYKHVYNKSIYDKIRTRDDRYMIKKFYYGLVSLKYVYFMFGIPLVVFVIAFLETKVHNPMLKVGMGICAVILAVVLFFYYRDKLRISKILKSVNNVSEYLKGGMVDRTYILEERMLACADLNLKEVKTTGIQKLEKVDERKGKPYLQLSYENEKVTVSAISNEEAQRFAAFIQRKNASVQLVNIETKGSGTLKERGASI